MSCARLPNGVFREIIEDLEAFAVQYGNMEGRENGKARARYLSGFFNRIVALFSGLISTRRKHSWRAQIPRKAEWNISSKLTVE
ncbi:hypothetical protein VTN77DRAFT_3217 [Rasamsonia byssochlamydoides]|uniref:uncharacterized protein n=1 Tax=Rasamsonia byssochlamydoides TaxID=89139 RepID=UPI0037444E75